MFQSQMVINPINTQTNLPQARLPSSSQIHLNALRNMVKILYDDISYEIINYIINLPANQSAEEQTLADNLNLTYTQVRQSLIQMEKHGILISTDFKRKKEEEEEDYNLTGMQGGHQQQSKKFIAIKKNKTSEWKMNETFYNIIKNRFEELKKKLEKNLEYRSKDKFECLKCKTTFMLSDVAYLGYVCKVCEDRPKLLEKKGEDVTLLRKKCNDIIQMISEEFIIGDKTGPDFKYAQLKTNIKSQREKKQVNTVNFPMPPGVNIDMIAPNPNEIYILNLEEPEIEEGLNKIKKDEKKLKKFKEIMELYSSRAQIT